RAPLLFTRSQRRDDREGSRQLLSRPLVAAHALFDFLVPTHPSHGGETPPSVFANTCLCSTPAAIAPAIGATQNSHSCASAQPPTSKAGPVLRAGFTDVLVTGMLTRWISVSARPIASGANAVGARLSVTPRMTSRKKN